MFSIFSLVIAFFDIYFNIKLLLFRVYVFLPPGQLGMAPVGTSMVFWGPPWEVTMIDITLLSPLLFYRNSDDFCHRFILWISIKTLRRNREERRKCINSFVAGIKCEIRHRTVKGHNHDYLEGKQEDI